MKLFSYFGNPWIGLYAKLNNNVILVPNENNEKFVQVIHENLGLDLQIIKISIANSNIHGVYCAMNSNGIILPNMVHENEILEIKKLGMNTYISKEKNNAHGNNLLINDKGGIINEHINPLEKKRMEDVLGIELQYSKVAGYTTVGSACIANNKGFLAHFNTSEQEMKNIEDALKVKGGKGSVNFGTGFLSLGFLANDKGYIAGEKTSAYEQGALEQALGYL